MKADPKPYLFHIRDACVLIESFLKDVSEEEFRQSKEKQSAVVRQIEIIGEAVRNLPEGLKKDNPNIPWGLISSMRNFLIHEYFAVDLDLVWDTATSEIPILKNAIEKLIEKPN